MDRTAFSLYEPTGAYHRAFEDHLAAARLPLAKVNPLHARRFAQSKGARARTDRIDARMLAFMGLAHQSAASAIPSANLRDLKQLQIARMALIKHRTAAKNRSKQITLAILKRQNTARLRQIADDLKAIEAAMEAIIAQESAMARTFEILCSIPGISKITAVTMLVEIPELGTLQPKKVAALAGLAPYTRQSGQYKGKRFIGAGRKFLREALYMPALVASRFNPDMKTMYQCLKENGKPAKPALTAIMRKLIILANTLVNRDRKWVEKGA